MYDFGEAGTALWKNWQGQLCAARFLGSPTWTLSAQGVWTFWDCSLLSLERLWTCVGTSVRSAHHLLRRGCSEPLIFAEKVISSCFSLQHRSLRPGWWHFWYLCVGNPEGSLWGEVHQRWHFLGWRRLWPGFATVYCERVQERGKMFLESTVLLSYCFSASLL